MTAGVMTMRALREMVGFIAGVGLVVVLIVGATYGYLHLYRDAAPKFEAARREVFEQTPSYVQGKVTLLTRLRLDYKRAGDDATKQTLREMIATESATIDHAKLPADLRTFVEGL